MEFNEKKFRHLIDETQRTIVALGTTSEVVLTRQKKFAEKLIDHLKVNDTPFERDSCLEWVDGMERAPASTMNSSYIEWIAWRRFVILLAEQEAGTLHSWKYYRSHKLEMPKSENFLEIIQLHQAFLFRSELDEKTVKHYTRYTRCLLIYLESQGIWSVSAIQNKDIADYFVSPRFSNRKPRGVQTEAYALKSFLRFLVEYGYTDCQSLPYAVPLHRVQTRRIITTLTAEMVSDIMNDDPCSLVNRRVKAVCLLALHVGLRSCDIRNLKFSDIDWEKGLLTIRQQKTDIDLQLPLDNETQNAIIDYVLNERRDCTSEYIFIVAVGPIRKISRKDFKIKHRAYNTASHSKIPHDGLHIFRRTFASRLLRCGTPLSTISEMLGHTDKEAVLCYLATDDEKMKRCALDLSLVPWRKEGF